MKSLIPLLLCLPLVSLLDSDAEACRRCGRSFCLACTSHVSPQVAVQSIPTVPNVNVLVNNYPSADQGSTLYYRDPTFNAVTDQNANNVSALLSNSRLSLEFADNYRKAVEAAVEANAATALETARAAVALEYLRGTRVTPQTYQGGSIQIQGGSITNTPSSVQALSGPRNDALGDFFAAKCYRCHNPKDSQGGLDLNKPGLRNDLDFLLRARARMVHSDPAKRMPKGSKSIDGEFLGELQRAIDSLETVKPAVQPNP